jgi:pimeloyl-ACP methyl ester carboxylesterase
MRLLTSKPCDFADSINWENSVEFGPDEGHTPHLSNPTKFVRTLRAFVQSTG